MKKIFLSKRNFFNLIITNISFKMTKFFNLNFSYRLIYTFRIGGGLTSQGKGCSLPASDL